MTEEHEHEEDDDENQVTRVVRVAARDIANVVINIIDWALLVFFVLLVVMNVVSSQPLHNATEALILIATIMIGLGAVKVIFGLWIKDPDRPKLYGFLDLGGKALILTGMILLVNEVVLIGVIMCVAGIASQIYFHQKIFRVLLSLIRD